MFRRYFNKYKEMILYIFFGGCTTLMNIVAYYISTRFFDIDYKYSTIIAWCISVLFAYVTNRIYVFKSKNTTIKSIIYEVITFIGCRILSGILDFVIMYVFIDLIKLDDLFIKIISNIIVIAFNYVASKILIFKKMQK